MRVAVSRAISRIRSFNCFCNLNLLRNFLITLQAESQEFRRDYSRFLLGAAFGKGENFDKKVQAF